MYRLLASAVNHPDQLNRLSGLFNHRSLAALDRLDVDVRAVVPRPYAPPIGPYSSYRSIPDEDASFTYPVSHPRFFYYLPKSVLYHRTGDSIASTLVSWYEDSASQYDFLHGCHLYPDGYGLSVLSDLTGMPFTAYAHGTIINEYQEFNSQTQQRIKTTLVQAEEIFCSGADIQKKIHNLAPEAETRVVPIGATPSNFPTERRARIRQELNIPADATVVLFCGHLTEAKGVQDILDVLQAVKNEELYFVFISHNGDLRNEIRSVLANGKTPAGELHWQLHPVAVRRWFVAADLLVLPSYSEGRPTVIYEAMAARTAILATAVGGIPEQVKDGETGWLIDPGDTEALRSRLQDLSKDELQKMGTAGEQRLIEKGWTWSSHAQTISDAHINHIGGE